MTARFCPLTDDELSLYAVCMAVPQEVMLGEILTRGDIDLADQPRIDELCTRWSVSPQQLGYRLAMFKNGM